MNLAGPSIYGIIALVFGIPTRDDQLNQLTMNILLITTKTT